MVAKRVLLVGDDPKSLLALALSLECLDLEVHEAVIDGYEANQAFFMKLARMKPPHVIILVVNALEEDICAFCDAIAHYQRIVEIPVILLTARPQEQALHYCQEHGFHHVVKCAAAWDELRLILCQLLDLQPGSWDTDVEEVPAAWESVPSATPTVLLIDDDRGLSQALQTRLKGQGFRVLCAFGGLDGYWMALREKPDVIVSDYTMPEGYGSYLLRRLKEHSLTRDIPVIVLTGRDIAGRPVDRKDFGLERQLLNLGAARVLSKPFDFDILLEEINQHLQAPMGAGAVVDDRGV
jgi:CheY-like chemotaxis protein